jgi:prevent-host-death family protein
MCVMERVGVRELRQSLSVYLRRVAQGETLEVTEHGRPVAVLAPLPDAGPVERLIAAGRVRPATRRLADLDPPLSATTGTTGTEALADLRDETGR